MSDLIIDYTDILRQYGCNATSYDKKIIAHDIGDGTIIWIKRLNQRKIFNIYAQSLNRILQKIHPIIMIPAIVYGQNTMIFYQQKSENILKSRKFFAPKILYANDYYMVLSSVGKTIQQRIAYMTYGDNDVIIKRKWAEKSVYNLARMHQHGLYHGRCKLHDIACDDDENFALLDFEEDYGNMTIHHLMIRDIIFLFAALGKYFSHDIDFMISLIKYYQQHHDNMDLWQEIDSIQQRVSWIMRLLYFCRQLSKDVNIYVTLYEIFKEYFEHHHSS